MMRVMDDIIVRGIAAAQLGGVGAMEATRVFGLPFSDISYIIVSITAIISVILAFLTYRRRK